MKRLFSALALVVAVLLTAFLPPAASADSPLRTSQQDPYALIDAVNGLRLAQGLPAYTVNSTLMGVAQAHAEYMASTGNITHTGADGSRPYQRALAAGYPLAGQIPPGFYSENIIGIGGDMTPQDAVQNWTGDAPHMNTMASPNLQEIGAGVAVRDGRIYYVIDAARPTTSGLPQAYTPGAAESSFSSSNELIMPVSKTTPNANGEIIHEVQAGQSLWQIAIEYGVKIDQIRSLNQLSVEYLINPGDTLLIMTVSSPTLAPATLTPQPSATLASTSSAAPTSTLAPPPTPTVTPQSLSILGSGSAGGAVAAIVIAALASAALVAWAGRARPV